MLEPTKIKWKIQELTKEIFNLERRSGECGNCKGRHAEFSQEEIEIHLDDLRQERQNLRKKLNKRTSSTGRLELPEFCFNSNKVSKYLKGVPL